MSDFGSAFEAQSRSNSSRWYLGADAEEELLGPPLQGSSPVSCDGTRFSSTSTVSVGFYGELLAQRLESVAVIRNTLAHNRAISDESGR